MCGKFAGKMREGLWGCEGIVPIKLNLLGTIPGLLRGSWDGMIGIKQFMGCEEEE